MSSGQRRIIGNSRERLITPDFNRAQAFIGRANAELVRMILLARYREDEGSDELVPAESPAAGPLTAIVAGGLRFRPTIGSVDAFVEPGALLIINPESPLNPDDSPGKLIVDEGVQTIGELALTAGDPALIRIDVIECAPSEIVRELDNRDVFDPTTGLFTVATVDKVSDTALNYRIRTGTPGAGFPGVAVGWLPLAVASVPANATTWDQCIIWDVRPRLVDRARSPLRTERVFGHYQVQWGIMRGSALRLRGYFEGVRGMTPVSALSTSVGSENRFGGLMMPSIDLADAVNVREPGFVAVASTPWYLYVCQPFGLPNWARYVDSNGQLLPATTPRGIPVLTQKAPAGYRQFPTAISLPTGTGLGGSTTNAMAVASGALDGAATFENCFYDGRRTWIGEGSGVGPGTGIEVTATPAGATVGIAIVPGTSCPPNATAIRVRAEVTFTGMGGDEEILSRIVEVRDAANTTTALVAGVHRFPVRMPALGSFTDRFEDWIPLMPNEASDDILMFGPVNQTIRLNYTSALAAFTITGAFASVVGWELGLQG
jgi:hypothetical protein